MSDTERQIVHDLTYMWKTKKIILVEADNRMMATRGRGGERNKEMLVKGCKVSVMQDE